MIENTDDVSLDFDCLIQDDSYFGYDATEYVENVIASPSRPYEPIIEDISDDEETAPVPERSYIMERPQHNGQVHVTGQQCSVTSLSVFILVTSYEPSHEIMVLFVLRKLIL